MVQYIITAEGRKRTKWYRGWDLTALEARILKYMAGRKTPVTLQEITGEVTRWMRRVGGYSTLRKSQVSASVRSLLTDKLIKRVYRQ